MCRFLKVQKEKEKMIKNNQVTKDKSVIDNYCTQIFEAFEELKVKVPITKVESIAIEVVRAMGSEMRDYHKPEHSLDVSKVNSPIASLAAIFHDCIYIQVDPSWKTNFYSYLGNFIPTVELNLDANDVFKTENSEIRKAILVLFGMESNSDLRLNKGLNELLSAIVMEHFLSPILTVKDVLSVAACIEATIPFRNVDADGNTSADRLKKRLNKAAQILNESFSEQEQINIIDWCREIVANDLASFASHRLNTFISNTWNVMNENNAALRNMYFYISEYRKAVNNVIPFLQSLDPNQMFWNSPEFDLDYRTRVMVENAKRNLQLGIDYLKTVGLSLSILEAIAIETGGDLPYEALVGPLRRSREHMPLSVGAFLPARESRSFNEDEKAVFLILKNGRETRARFDRKDFPLGAYLYQHFKIEVIHSLWGVANEFHNGKINPKSFLEAIPNTERIEIFEALVKVASIRSANIFSLLKSIEAMKSA